MAALERNYNRRLNIFVGNDFLKSFIVREGVQINHVHGQSTYMIPAQRHRRNIHIAFGQDRSEQTYDAWHVPIFNYQHDTLWRRFHVTTIDMNNTWMSLLCRSKYLLLNRSDHLRQSPRARSIPCSQIPRSI